MVEAAKPVTGGWRRFERMLDPARKAEKQLHAILQDPYSPDAAAGEQKGRSAATLRGTALRDNLHLIIDLQKKQANALTRKCAEVGDAPDSLAQPPDLPSGTVLEVLERLETEKNDRIHFLQDAVAAGRANRNDIRILVSAIRKAEDDQQQELLEMTRQAVPNWLVAQLGSRRLRHVFDIVTPGWQRLLLKGFVLTAIPAVLALAFIFAWPFAVALGAIIAVSLLFTRARS